MTMRNCRLSFTECWNTDNMDRVNQICDHPLWKFHMAQLQKAEKERIFCKHGIEHLMDVARIAYIEKLEQNLNYSKEVIYGAALLHDIGRFLQYSQGIPHETAGADLAARILKDCGFCPEEQSLILSAISEHRNMENQKEVTLAGLIYRADKQSRMCKFCPAAAQCNWSEEKKNHLLKR